MTSENCKRKAAGASLQASRVRLRAAAHAAHAATRGWAREREMQRVHTAEMVSEVRQQVDEVAAVLEQAERLADATRQPLGVWDEAAAVLDDAGSGAPGRDDGLAWALNETAALCSFLLDGATGGETAEAVARIDGVLEALGEGQR